MTTTAPPTTPRRPALDRDTAFRLAATEYDRVGHALADLRPEDWSRPTACPEWDVRQLGCHVVGMAALTKSPLEVARQQRLAGKVHATRGGPLVDSMTQVQVEERADWTPEQVVAGVRAIAPKAVRGRKRLSAIAGRVPLGDVQVINGLDERWTLGYLARTILTRDPWMHRSDLAEATGRPMHVTADHDGVIVADVVAEWASRHGQPFHLELTGPAGGIWASGEAPLVTLDAIEFCRILSGRGDATGLLRTQVPF